MTFVITRPLQTMLTYNGGTLVLKLVRRYLFKDRPAIVKRRARRPIVDVNLGPWTAAHAENKSLAEAMGDEAWKTVDKTAGFTPKQAPKGQSATKGYTISGRLTSVVKEGSSSQIFSAFTILVDGTMSNVPPIQGTGYAEGGNTAEDAVRAITESRIAKILATLKTGRVVKAA